MKRLISMTCTLFVALAAATSWAKGGEEDPNYRVLCTEEKASGLEWKETGWTHASPPPTHFTLRKIPFLHLKDPAKIRSMAERMTRLLCTLEAKDLGKYNDDEMRAYQTCIEVRMAEEKRARYMLCSEYHSRNPESPDGWRSWSECNSGYVKLIFQTNGPFHRSIIDSQVLEGPKEASGRFGVSVGRCVETIP